VVYDGYHMMDTTRKNSAPINNEVTDPPRTVHGDAQSDPNAAASLVRLRDPTIWTMYLPSSYVSNPKYTNDTDGN
jgi:hypothetical protein